jgi:hypothetical protein
MKCVLQVKDGSTRPASAKPGVAPFTCIQSPGGVGSPRSDDSPRRSRSASPKPKLSSSTAYKKVKYQRKSWDEFSDHIWDKLNEEGEEEGEAAGGEEGSENKHREGDDGISEPPQVTGNNAPITKEAGDENTSDPKPDLEFNEDGREVKTVQEPSVETDNESEPEADRSAGRDVPDINILASSTDTIEHDEEANASADLRQSVANQCIKEVVAETIFSMTELEPITPPAESIDFDEETLRSSSVLENIAEENEEDAGQSKQDVNERGGSAEQSKEDVDENSGTAEQSKQEADPEDSSSNVNSDDNSDRTSPQERPMRMC